MYRPRSTTQFKKDMRLIGRRGRNTSRLEHVMRCLSAGTTLVKRHRDHPLVGNYRSYRECHIEPDWLLIYKIQNDEIIFARTGTHSDLFG